MDLERAHKLSFQNRALLLSGIQCGCFCCLQVFPVESIAEWLHDKGGDTAVCPHCGIDSVIGEGLGFPVTREFLAVMHRRWFGSAISNHQPLVD
jgi:hypothetical protein